jgi:predicted transcriptional regulator
VLGAVGGGDLADRRREEDRGEAAVALGRIRERGETIAAIARLTNVSEREVRGYLKAANGSREAAAQPLWPVERAAERSEGAGAGVDIGA